MFTHISRVSMEIETREKPKRKRGRPKEGEKRVKEPTQPERQRTMNFEEMLENLTKDCDSESKNDVYKKTWIGYELAMDFVKWSSPHYLYFDFSVS